MLVVDGTLAILLAARVRPKFIGGERAIYDEHLKDGYPEF